MEPLFTPKKSFFQLPIVRFTFGIFISISLFSALVISISSGLSFDWTYAGFNNFITYFRFPLGALAVLIPIIGVMAANHRSVLTIKQINSAYMHTMFSNYIAHKNDLIAKLDSLVYDGYHPYLFNPSETYRQIYSGAEWASFDINSRTTKVNQEMAKGIGDLLRELEKTLIMDTSWIVEVCRHLAKMEQLLGIKFKGKERCILTIDALDIYLPDDHPDSFLDYLKNQFNYIMILVAGPIPITLDERMEQFECLIYKYGEDVYIEDVDPAPVPRVRNL